jgi:hypothetical protein
MSLTKELPLSSFLLDSELLECGAPTWNMEWLVWVMYSIQTENSNKLDDMID